MNPLLSNPEFPEFGKIRPEHVIEAVDTMVASVQEGLARIESDTRPPGQPSALFQNKGREQ